MSYEQTIPFAIVPSEVVMDTRLTLETMRVLVALYSFRNKNTGLAFPSRESISERCGMHPSNISEATTKLVDLGWIIKDGIGGHSKATRYTITIPEVVTELAALHKAKSQARRNQKVAEPAMVAQSATVAEPATQTIAEPATPPIAQSATRIEQTNRTDKGTKNIATSLLPNIDPQIAADYLKIRKAKNSPLTETALKGIKREAEKAGLALEQVLVICCEQNWAGFKATWLLKDSRDGKETNKQEALEKSNRAATEGWKPPELRSL